MKKVTILALHLGYGGVERCIINLANSICNDYDVEIMATYRSYGRPALALDNKVTVNYLVPSDLARRVITYKSLLKSGRLIKLCKVLWNDYLKKGHVWQLIQDTYNSIITVYQKKHRMIHYLKQCDSDIIISTRDIHNLWLGKYGPSKSIKIGWEHNHHNGDQKYIDKIVKSVQNLDYFVLVSKDLTNFYKPLVKPKCIYIPNSIKIHAKDKSSLDNKEIISVGRLSKEKGFTDLLQVFDLVHQQYPDWHLTIVGDGPESIAIKKRLNALKLQKYVELPGFLDNTELNQKYKSSAIYVMTSFTESFGIVLLEAMAYGIPCIAFDSAQGACEIINDGIDGYLIKKRNKEEMANIIIKLINNKTLRKEMGRMASKNVLNYSEEKFADAWFKLLKKRK